MIKKTFNFSKIYFPVHGTKKITVLIFNTIFQPNKTAVNIIFPQRILGFVLLFLCLNVVVIFLLTFFQLYVHLHTGLSK